MNKQVLRILEIYICAYVCIYVGLYIFDQKKKKKMIANV